jgi:hypothetical protein
MVTPTELRQIKDQVISIHTDTRIQGRVNTARSVEEIETILVEFDIPTADIETVITLPTVREAKDIALENVTNEEDRAKIESAKTSDEVAQVLDDADEAQSGGWLDDVLGILRSAAEGRISTNITGLREEYNVPEGQPEYDTGFWGRADQVAEMSARAQQMAATAPQSVQDFVDETLDNEGIGLKREEIEAAYVAVDVEEAMDIIYDTLYATNASTEQFEAADEMYKDRYHVTSRGKTLTGNATTKEALRTRIGYEGEFAENHDYLIENNWLIQVDADENIFYINPADREVLDVNSDRVGQWDYISGEISFLDRTDARRPIGMGIGTYGTAATGADSINVPAGLQSIPLQEWMDEYGFGIQYEDLVTGMDWEDVFIQELGAQGFRNWKQGMVGWMTRGAGPKPDITEVETAIHYQYLEGSDVNRFIDMSIEEMTEQQQAYESMDIGYKAKKYGRFDQHFIELNNMVMTQANQDYTGHRDGFEKVMADMLEDPSYASNLKRSRGGGTSRVWRPPAYLAPDYAELSQAVKVTFAQKLGREPSDAEITLLSKKMQADHRAEFDSQLEAQKMQFYGSGGGDAGTVQDVNYAARFQEDFELRHEAELGTLDKIEQSRSITQSALGSILQADRAAGY